MKISIAIVLALLFSPLAVLQADDSRPNIVFLFTDDQTVGAMGCYALGVKGAALETNHR